MTAALLQAARNALRTGDAKTALAAVTQALAQKETAEAWDLKGDIYLGLGQIPAAVDAHGRAAAREPNHPTYAHDLGRSLLQARRFAEAEAALLRTASLKPAAWDVFCDLGTAQLEQRRLTDALVSFTKSIALKPDAALAYFNQGIAQLELARLAEAEASFRKTLAIQPSFLPAMMSLATLLGDLGNRAEAERLFEHARRLAPQDALFPQAYALVKLRYGDLGTGFELYESRFRPSPFGIQTRPFAAPRWRGEDLTGRDILLWTEQGLGDEILAASLVPEIISRARSCTIECSERAAPLFERSFAGARVVARSDPPDATLQTRFDFQSPVWSLAAHLRPDMTSFPHHASYLRADAGLTAQLRTRYRARDPGARIIGISWDSAARHGGRKRLPLAMWKDILAVPGCTFVSLQYGVRSDSPELAGLAQRIFVDDDIDALRSLDASAAQVAAMDQVITVSNTTAHLAGAQNIPVWTLVPEGPGCFWYWFRDRMDSPWYPSMRFFRQPAPGDWAGVAANVAAALVEQVGQIRL